MPNRILIEKLRITCLLYDSEHYVTIYIKFMLKWAQIPISDSLFLVQLRVDQRKLS